MGKSVPNAQVVEGEKETLADVTGLRPEHKKARSCSFNFATIIGQKIVSSIAAFVASIVCSVATLFVSY